MKTTKVTHLTGTSNLNKKLFDTSRKIDILSHCSIEKLKSYKKSSRRVGCILVLPYDGKIVNTFWTNLITALKNYLETLDFSLDFILTRENFANLKRCQEYFRLLPDGMIWINAFHHGAYGEDWLLYQHLKPLIRAHVGIMCQSSSIDNICFEKAEAIELVVNHLVEHGRTRLAYLGDPGFDGTLASSSRFQGYCHALKLHGFPIHQDYIVNAQWEHRDSLQLTHQLLSVKEHPDAIICMDDAKAFKVFRAIYEQNLKIPLDIAVTGYNDLPFSAYLSPSLTTVNVPIDNISTAAVNTLMSRINEDQTPIKNVVFRTTLVVRQST